MRRTSIRDWFIPVAAFVLLIPASGWGMDVNLFYQGFVECLKGSRYADMEQLVRKNPNEAQQSIEVLRKRIPDEKDEGRREALNVVLRELDELTAVTSGRADCELSESMAHRGKRAVLPEEGLEIYRRAVRLCPENRNALLGLADMNKRSGAFEDAVAGYEKILAMDKDAPEALLGMAEVLYSAGLCERGVSYLNTLLAEDPHNKSAKRLLRSCESRISQVTDAVISSQEIADRLRSSLGGNLMCMCPARAKLMARVRFRSITFPTDGAGLNGRARAQLAQLAGALETEALRDGRYFIEGYADPIGTKEYNAELSATRAEAVRKYLVDVLKVNPAVVSAAGMGGARSWTTNKTAAGRRANRRIEVIRIGPVAAGS